MISWWMPLVLCFACASEAEDLDAKSFRELHRSLVVPEREPWQTIPWQTDLLAARDRAVATGKPLFLWSMNGHPLGCT